jgi:hypothetical protein
MFRRLAAGVASFSLKAAAKVGSAWARRQVQSIKQIPGQVQAAVRQGANDLHNAIVPALPTSQRGVEQPGTPLSPTQMAVNQDQGRMPQMDRGRSVNQMIEAQSSRSQSPNRGRGMDM